MTTRTLQNAISEANGLEGMGFYYSIYDGIVTDNDDPDKKGKICIQVGASLELKWVEPCNLFAGKLTCDFDIPAISDPVRVLFQFGQIEHPLWLHSGYWANGNKPTQIDSPDDYLRIFKNGILFKASKENETFEITTPDGVSVILNNTEKFVRLVIGDTIIESHNDGLIIKKGSNSLKTVITELGNAVKDAQTFKTLLAADLNTMAGSNPAGAVVFAGTLNIAAPLSPTTKTNIDNALNKISQMFKE